MTDLKPCPFCGGQAALYHHTPAGIEPSWHVECADEDGGDEGCGCGTCHHETKAESIASWNTRAEPLAPAHGDVERVARKVWEQTASTSPNPEYYDPWDKMADHHPAKLHHMATAAAALAAIPDDRASIVRFLRRGNITSQLAAMWLDEAADAIERGADRESN